MEATATPQPRGFVPLSQRLLRLASDDRLVEQVRAGSEPAFEALYERHHRPILSFCRHMLGSAHEAEDAVQHTFLSAYRNLVGSDKRIHLRAWLYAIARNRCLSILRARRERPSGEEEVPELATEGLVAEVQRRQDLRELLTDLHDLPEMQRAALVLAELGDLSHDQIGQALGCRRERVKALIFQAREALAAGRDARATPCTEIRRELSTARGAALRRAPLRRHLRECEGCRGFRDEVQRQRAALALALPVLPSAALKAGALPWLAAATGGGGATGAGATGAGAAGAGAAAGAAAATAGAGAGAVTSSGGAALLLGSGSAAKALAILAVAAATTAGGVATVNELKGPDAPARGGTRRVKQPAKAGARAPSTNASPTAKATSPPQSTRAQGVKPARRAGAGGNAKRARRLKDGRRQGTATSTDTGRGRSQSAPGRTKGGASGGGGGNGNAGGNGIGRSNTGGSSRPQGGAQGAGNSSAPGGNGTGGGTASGGASSGGSLNRGDVGGKANGARGSRSPGKPPNAQPGAPAVPPGQTGESGGTG